MNSESRWIKDSKIYIDSPIFDNLILINMSRGGKRSGAGRKQGFAAKSAEEARKLLSERLNQEIGSIADILVSKAKDGDMQAIKELFDRAWGRPPQSTRVENGGEPVTLQIVNYKDMSNDDLQRLAYGNEKKVV